jgi:hypothetical protein
MDEINKPVILTQTLFDQAFAYNFGEFFKQEDWAGMIAFSVDLLENHNPDEGMRVELLTAVAMGQIGMAQKFTRELESYGKALRDKLFVTPAEAKVVMENVMTAAGLNADGFGKVVFPTGESDAKPE